MRPPVCRYLRARSAYGPTPEGAAWVLGTSAVEGTWCLATGEPAGPDDALAEARTCRAGRACFVPADDTAEPA